MLQHRSEHLSAGHIISESEYHPQEIPNFIVPGRYSLYLKMLEYSPNLKPAVHDGGSHQNGLDPESDPEESDYDERLSNEKDPEDFDDNEGYFDDFEYGSHHDVFEEIKSSIGEGSMALFCHEGSIPSTPESDHISSTTKQNVLRQNISPGSMFSATKPTERFYGHKACRLQASYNNALHTARSELREDGTASRFPL